MHRIAAFALVAAVTGSALVGAAGPSVAAARAPQVAPTVSTVPNPLQEVNALICLLFGNSVLCGIV